MERIVKMQKPFDKRHSDPNKNYGVGALTITMILKGDKGAIQFQFSTGMYLPHVLAEWKKKNYYPDPMGYDVGYHSPKSIYDNQEPIEDNCSIIGGTCYYDGSSLRADEWFNIFLNEGDERIWSMMEDEYHSIFN